MAYTFFVIVCLLFGSNFKFMDDATQVFGPITIGTARLLGGAAVLLGVVYLKRQSLVVDRSTFAKILFVAVLANAYPFAIQPWILSQGVDHSFLAIFVPLTPLMTIFAAVPLLGVRPTWQQSLGVLVGFLLLAWIAWADAETHNFPRWLLPIAVTVPLSYAIGNTFLRRNLQHASSLVVSTLLLAIAGLLLLPLAVWESTVTVPSGSPEQWWYASLALVILGPIGTGACIGMFVWLVQDRGPLFAGMVTYVVPVVALAWGFRDGETISLPQVLAILGILCMVALVQSSQANYSPATSGARR